MYPKQHKVPLTHQSGPSLSSCISPTLPPCLLILMANCWPKLSPPADGWYCCKHKCKGGQAWLQARDSSEVHNLVRCTCQTTTPELDLDLIAPSWLQFHELSCYLEPNNDTWKQERSCASRSGKKHMFACLCVQAHEHLRITVERKECVPMPASADAAHTDPPVLPVPPTPAQALAPHCPHHCESSDAKWPCCTHTAVAGSPYDQGRPAALRSLLTEEEAQEARSARVRLPLGLNG